MDVSTRPICSPDVNNNKFASLTEVHALLQSMLSQKIELSLQNFSNHDIPHSSMLSPPATPPLMTPPSSPSVVSCKATDSSTCFRPSRDFHIFGAVESGNDARFSSAKYKTELCRAFEEHGHCRYGSKCHFAHGGMELRALNRHPKYKTDLCYTFHTMGFCPYGMRCNFIHNDDERRQCSTAEIYSIYSAKFQQLNQQRVRLRGDDNLSGAPRNFQVNDDGIADHKLVLQLASLMTLLDEHRIMTQSSSCKQFSTSHVLSQSVTDPWTYCPLPSSSSVFDPQVSNSSPVAFKSGQLSVADVEGQSLSATSPFISDVMSQSPTRNGSSPVRMSLPTGSLMSPPPGLPPLPPTAVKSELRSLSYDELIAVAIVKQAMLSRDVDVQDIVGFVQSSRIKSATRT